MSKVYTVVSIIYRGRCKEIFGLLLILFAGISPASSFVTIELPQNISFQMPRNWVVLSGNTTITLDAFLESVMPNVTSDIKFQANLKNDSEQPIAQVQIYYWSSEFLQSDVKGLSKVDVVTYNHNIRLQIEDELSDAGVRVTSWLGTTKKNINGLNVLISEYSRPSKLIQGHFRVQLLRIYCGVGSFSFVVSYHEEEILPLRPIADKIISTLQSDLCKE